MKTNNTKKTKFLTLMMLFLSVNFGYAQERTELSSMEIADAIEDQFFFDHAVDVNKISVIVTEGIAELTGTVNNVKAKERATRLAEMVKGVRSVSNRISVSPTLVHSDESIRNNIESALLADPATESYEVDIAVKKGKVTLTGTVDSYQEKELCADVAKSVNGVVSLNNKIDIEYKITRTDQEIENEVEQTLKWNETVDDGLIDVDVKNGNLTLKGTVGSAAERRNASWASWVAGVRSVDDSDLDVAWWAKDDQLRANKNVTITDEEIADAIKDATLYDPRVYSHNVDPNVDLGWVTLRGTVDNLKAKKAAGNLARNTLGVNGVTNRIKVRVETPPSDKEIKEKIESAFALNAITEPSEIETFVTNGIVTLTGTVDSYTEKSEAEWVASGVEGVSVVDNILTVNYPYSYYFYGPTPYYDWYYPTSAYLLSSTLPDDKDIKRSVQSELWWSPYVEAAQVDVKVDNGTVTLEGKVDSWKEYEKAAENAWEGGAWSLNNQLTIE